MISLYRGELHKVSGITRQWPLPKPTISLSAFRQALVKRNAALRGSPLSLPSPCLARQDTCVSGSHNVSPLHPHTATGAEEPDRDVAGEGRGESDGKVKETDYMDEDVHEEADNIEPGSRPGRVVQRGSSVTNGEEVDRDACVRVEDSSALMPSKSHPSEEHEFKHEVKLEGAETVEQEDQAERKERKKRKREEASMLEAKKGKVKVKEEGVAGVASGALEPAVFDAEWQSEDMELDQKAQDRFVAVGEATQPGGLAEVKEEGRGGKDPKEETGAGAELGLFKSQCEVKIEREAEERDVVKVEAPSTPPVHYEEQIPSAAEEARTATNAISDKKVRKAELEAKLKTLTAEKHRLVQMLKQVLSTEEVSKKKVQNTSQSPPAPGPPVASQAAPTSTDAPAVPNVQSEITVASTVEVQASADLEEGELEYARTPSPPPHTPTTSHSTGHGGHTSHGAPSSLGPLLGRQPQHISQGGATRGGYYQQGLGIPSPNPAAAAAVAGGMSPGTGFMPIALGGRPYHNMALQHAIHVQKVAIATAAAAASHPHLSPILGGGPAGAGNGVTSGPPGFGGYGVSPSVHGHHGHMPQGASPGAGHIASQQGVVSPSLLTTPRGAPGYHDMRLGNPGPWGLQR